MNEGPKHISAGAAAASAASRKRSVLKELTLPSGAQAVVYDGYGRDVKAAYRMVDVAVEGQWGVVFALTSRTVEIDGKAITVEDLDDMLCWDVLALIGAVLSSGKLSPPPISPN